MNLILFDGECNLCNRAIRFIIKHDHKALFRFASSQSAIGKKFLAQYGLHTEGCKTIVYIEKDRCSVRSTAALRILRELGGIWKYGYVFIVIPPFLRDFLYSAIARIRYRFFGKTTSCKVFPQDIRNRFLDRINYPE